MHAIHRRQGRHKVGHHRETQTSELGSLDASLVHSGNNPVQGENKVQGVSYANKVKGNKVDNKPSLKDPVKKCVLGEEEYQSRENFSRVVLGEVNNATIIPQLYRLCYSEGFEDVKIQYVGGMWVWIEFISEDKRSSFIKNIGVGTYFKQLIPPSDTFEVKERAVWLEVQGLPLRAWSVNAHKKVASFYGTVMFSDDEEYRSCGRICVCSMIMENIDEKMLVMVEGKEYTIHIREVENWWPDILKVEVELESNSQVETNDNSDEEVDSLVPSEMAEDNEVIPESFNEGMKNMSLKQNNVEMDNQDQESEEKGEDTVSKVEENNINNDVQSKMYVNQSGNQTEESDPSFPPGFNRMRFHSTKEKTTEVDKERGSTAMSTWKGKKMQLHKKSLSTVSLIDDVEKYVEIGGLLGYDLSGCREDIRRLLHGMGEKHGVQETKLTMLDLFLVRSIWGNNQFEVASSGARGRSGGLLTIWDPNVFQKLRIWCTENVIIVKGKVMSSGIICFLVNVYAPQDRNRKKEVWEYLTRFMGNQEGEYIIFGDFNVVRFSHERS
ncbi:endonuclease/exonuclease/phosphatase family protein [Artemisia annua]|uniref:Endonuclease/exonuclease/phosphatase family protein n=1 Tax=Artemisia annua TaxID=35608 RepID=A0A2U1LFB8_ARTAN|nr:endonuclease/exonuclease/phosphatase family protein [Artemisia annua]